MSKSIKSLIVIGDRVLVKPKINNGKTDSGLYLPPGVKEKEKIQSGYVIKVGPGYAISTEDDEELWKAGDRKARYIPLQASEGDLAIFLLQHSHEIIYKNEKYFIVPQSGILLLERMV
ncbi:co-chaperone GroES [Bacteroidetes bacterium endosymbiont of Geopemphigus sp.]|uniref:co-chaperone GroES n=1 Tax=Bacteroidetes bacterium endosymbiont of Geopemphigus sp. TaxID=2047937 RepID=UPI000CD0ECB1|nr:co-chaperone GroES family protein [Bacteroidetes bacterium endosymbiont of Geopemphigus sp.]